LFWEIRKDKEYRRDAEISGIAILTAWLSNSMSMTTSSAWSQFGESTFIDKKNIIFFFI
jgi:hypothetical protein